MSSVLFIEWQCTVYTVAKAFHMLKVPLSWPVLLNCPFSLICYTILSGLSYHMLFHGLIVMFAKMLCKLYEDLKIITHIDYGEQHLYVCFPVMFVWDRSCVYVAKGYYSWHIEAMATTDTRMATVSC